MSSKMLILVVFVSLIVSAVHAQTEDITTDWRESGQKYNGRVYTFYNLGTTPPKTINVILLEGSVSGNGLKLSAPSLVQSSGTVNLNLSSTTVKDATISFEGTFNLRSSLIVEYTEVSMQSNKPVFSISNLNLMNSSTLAIINVQGSYSSASNAGYVIDSSAASNEPFQIIGNSGLYLININFNNAVGIFRVRPTDVANINENSALTIDYSTCTSCSQAIATFPDSTIVSNNSLLRINKNNITGTNTQILKADAQLSFESGSLLEINNCTSEGSAFTFAANAFSVNNAQVVYSNISAPSSGISASVPLPIKVYPLYTEVYAGGCILNKIELTTIDGYKSHGINADKILGADGRSSGQCLFATCVPGNNNPSQVSGVCDCNCINNAFAPSCTGSSDPITSYEANSNNGSCKAFHCQQCDSFNASRCATCLPGYVLNTNYQCKLPPCRVSNCAECVFNSSPQQCKRCRQGYHFSIFHWCIRNIFYDKANYIQITPLIISSLFVAALGVTTIV